MLEYQVQGLEYGDRWKHALTLVQFPDPKLDCKHFPDRRTKMSQAASYSPRPGAWSKPLPVLTNDLTLKARSYGTMESTTLYLIKRQVQEREVRAKYPICNAISEYTGNSPCESRELWHVSTGRHRRDNSPVSLCDCLPKPASIQMHVLPTWQ